jgi:energy-coupling factor transport system ATP-binding protein
MDIHISDLAFRYANGIQVLRDISLHVPAGARTALLGQNGAGKTTLVKQLNGLLKPTRGSVQVGDWDTREHSIAQMAQRVGLLFQNPDDQLFKTRVQDEIAFGPANLLRAQRRVLDKSEIAQRVERALAWCGLAYVRDAHPYDLPPWQRRWVAIACVVAMQTPIVILDEPTTGQDAFGMARLVRLLDEWARARVTVLTVTHDVDFAVEHFSDLIVMEQGEILARGNANLFLNVEIRARAALEPPQLLRLAAELNWQGIPATVEAFCEMLAQKAIRD